MTVSSTAALPALQRRTYPTPASPRAPPSAPVATGRPTGVGASGPARAACRHRVAVPVGAGSVRLGELVLLRGRSGRRGELESVLLWIVGRGKLDHRR